MVKLIKSEVKCYKKKTKKSVGGQKKTYEYNQYLVPLKRSDNLACSTEVFILPQSEIEDLIDENGEIKDISQQENEYKIHLAQYKTDLADLEWKHGQLSRSYKELVNKHNKTRRKVQELEDKIKTLESDRSKLITALKKERKMTENIRMQGAPDKNLLEQGSKGQDKLTQNNVTQDKEIQVNGNSAPAENKDDKDIWTVLKSRLSKKEQEENEE